MLSLLILIALLATEIGILQDTKNQEQRNYEKVQFLVKEKEAESKDLIFAILKDTSGLNKNWMELLETAKSQNFILHIYKNDTLNWWSDNTINASKYLPALKEGFVYLNTNNGAYWVSYIAKGSYKITVFYQIKTNYQFQNQYIQNHLNVDLTFVGSAIFSPSPIKDFIDLTDRKGNYLCSIQIFGFPKTTPHWLKLVILLNILITAWFFHKLCKPLISKYFILGTITFLGLTQAARWIFLKYKIPVFVYAYPQFGPDIYASSIYNPSLGDFIIAALLLLWYLLLIKDVSFAETKNRFSQIIHLGLTTLVSIILADACFDSLKSLVFDSQISFDVKNIYAIDVNSFLGLILAFLILISCYQMVLRLFSLLKRSTINVFEKLLIVIFVLYFLEPYLVLHLFERNVNYVYGSSLLIGGFMAYIYYIKERVNRLQSYFMLVVVLSIFTSYTLYYYSSIREQEKCELLASKLISQNDVNAEYFLTEVEKQIGLSNVVKSYYQSPIPLNSQLVKYLRQLYFSGYLSKYNISVYDYDSAFNHYQARNLYTYAQVNYIYKNLGTFTINQNFKFLKNNAYLKGYLGRFVIKDMGKIQGYIFIHLQPKLQQDETRFDELLINGFRSSSNRQLGYSSAIYRDLQLLSQSGEYAYRTTFTWNDVESKKGFVEENGYHHLLFKENEQLMVVISRKSENWYDPFGLFSLSFTFFTLLLIFIILLFVLFNNHLVERYWLKNNSVIGYIRMFLNQLFLFKDADLKLIRTQIQLGIVLIVFFTLATTAYFTISFITSENKLKQNEKMVKKMRSVVNALENESQEVNFNGRQTDAEASINQIADFYNTDISLFNPQGVLVASTIKKVYDDGIIAPMMNPGAFFHLNNLRESQFTHEEAIATFYYNGTYSPVFSRNKSLLGYVQLPNFYQTSDLNNEISSIIVGFINLYALMFIAIGVMAWLVSRNISYPLMLIQKQLSQTSIGKKNEPINWDRKDEIGELVREYNLMIDQLQLSAEKLAQSEREGAWRDIARQIAHEIKNPLTPMKLSVQHLERAWNDQSPKLPETFKKVTRTLITQIDILSELATEFSSFAKMPAPENELIDVHELLEQMVHLQEHSFEGEISYFCEANLTICFDKGYLTRTLTNLIKNGIQAIPEDRLGKIRIEAHKEGDHMHLWVSDNGTGINEEQKEKIFMPYYSTKVIGMGLGLPIVKSMIESGGGKLWFQTKEGEGTTFHVLLPLNMVE